MSSELFFSAQELAGKPGMPSTDRGVRIAAERAGWECRKKSAGKGLEYSLVALPLETQRALQAQHMEASLPVVVTETALTVAKTPAQREQDLTDAQRAERDARLVVLKAIKRFQSMTNCSQKAAMVALLAWAASGQADPVTQKMLQMARDPRGRAGNGLPSERTLKRWLSDEKRGVTALAPKVKQADMTPPAWAKTFLACYQVPQKVSVEEAHRQAFGDDPDAPSIHQVRRFLQKLGTVTREAGRMGPRELKNIQPFIRRDISELEPNDIWTGDGHTFDAEVQHPLHGRPFRPEITTFLDIRTRRAVAWSVGLAESSWAVADALRWGMERNGIPALIYVDNGSGYRNAFMSDEATGLVGRVGSTMVHSLPYNSQARGVIERAHQTLWVQGAKLLPTYMGAAMDRERFHSRVLSWIPAQPVSMSDARSLAPIYCPECDIADDLLSRLVKISGGSVRRVSVNLAGIAEVAAVEGWGRATLADWADRPLYTGDAPKRGA